MLWVLTLLLTILVVLLARNSGTTSIGIPKSTAPSYAMSQDSLMNTTEDEYSKIMLVESNQTSSDNYENNGNMSIISFGDTKMDVSNFSLPDPPTNKTCIRRDYTDDVAAIFREDKTEEVGPISTAALVFNTTYSIIKMGRIRNTTELVGLTMLNETTVDCYDYPLITTKRLNRFTKSSLLGGSK